jgi:hypothetical protein
LAGLPALFHEVRLQRSTCQPKANRSRPSSIWQDPNTGAAHQRADHSAEAKIEARLEKVPEVLRVMSLDSFVPDDQPAKLKLIAQAATVVGPALNPDEVDAAPTDAENVDALKSSVDSLRRAAGDGKGPGAVASRGRERCRLAERDRRRDRRRTFCRPLKIVFDQLRTRCRPGR